MSILNKRGNKLKKLKESYFVKTCGLIKKNPKKISRIVLFDVLLALFCGLFLVIMGFFSKFITPLISELSTKIPAGFIILFVILYPLIFLFLIPVFIYSSFKYLILKSLKSLFKKIKIELKGLKKFYLLNVFIFFMFFAISFILNIAFLISAKQEYKPVVFFAINIPLFLIFYIFTNINHALFSESGKSSIKSTFNLLAKVKSYAGVILANIIAVIVYSFIFYLIGSILKSTLFKGYLASVRYYNIYTVIFAIITTLFLYLIVFFNRIYFYNIIRNRR